jgi:TFIIF-interacting CTD phosphatase-like protein
LCHSKNAPSIFTLHLIQSFLKLKTRLIVLDIDETLVYTTDKPLPREPHYTFSEYSIYRRPYLAEFLAFCFERFDVGVWSSASERYVSFVASQIFERDSGLKFVWSEKNCITESSGQSQIKDLRKLRRFGYLVDEIRAIDDTPEKYKRQLPNLIKIEPFRGNFEDNCLLKIRSHLESL